MSKGFRREMPRGLPGEIFGEIAAAVYVAAIVVAARPEFNSIELH